MENTQNQQEVKNLTPEEEIGFKLEKVIDLQNLSENSVLIFKVKTIKPSLLQILERMDNQYGDLLLSKKCTMLVMTEEDSLDSLSEQDMKKHGWIKQEEKRIITLDKL